MSVEPLRPGEPVTLVLPDHVVMATVDMASKNGFMCKLSSRRGKVLESRWKLEDEGTGWLRGYHLADSPAVKACQTAQALAPKSEELRPPKLGAATLGFLGETGSGVLTVNGNKNDEDF